MFKLFRNLGFWFFLLGSLVFWFFIIRGGVYDSWYPIIGHLIASHGGLIATILYIYPIRNKK